MGINGNIKRMGSLMVASNIKKLSRLELLYVCVANTVKLLDKKKEVLPESMKHYIEPNDQNKVIYHARSTDVNERIRTVQMCIRDRSWAKPFADIIFPAIDEKPFAVLYCDNSASRPNTPVNVIIGLLILKEYLGLTDDEVLESLLFDVRFQYACLLYTSRCV